MKRAIVIILVIVIFSSVFFFVSRSNQPKKDTTEIALCTANIYEEAKLTGSVKVLSVLHKGDEFVLTGACKTADNGKGAKYSLWEGVTADGIRGWVKANAFYSTDSHGW